jgi:hypothetical protein
LKAVFESISDFEFSLSREADLPEFDVGLWNTGDRNQGTGIEK